MPSMRGSDTYLVNLWLSPSPAKVGTNDVTTQVTTTIGTATPLDSVVFYITGPNGGTPQTITTTANSGSSKRHDSFSAPVKFDSAGPWQLTVEIHNGDVTRTTTFNVNVGQS
jgi:hypothetical protein